MNEPEPAPGDDDQSLDAIRRLRAENKQLRERTRAAEEAYAGAAAVVSAMQHTEIERIAGEQLVDPTDIWRAGGDVSIETFVDEQFHSVVGDRVVEQAKQLIQSKPHLAKPTPATPPPSNRPIEGLRSGARQQEPAVPADWATALRG